jgi:hypothetical protein
VCVGVCAYYLLASEEKNSRHNNLHDGVLIGTDEDAIIKVLVSHDNRQRQDIKLTYKTLFGRVFTFILFCAFDPFSVCPSTMNSECGMPIIAFHGAISKR